MTDSTPPRQRPRSTPVIASLAVLLALWLGLAAPEVSPVAPPADAQAVPAADGDGDRGGRGRR